MPTSRSGKELDETFGDDEDADFEDLETGLGEKIEWASNPVFTGIYVEQRDQEVTGDQSADGKPGIAHPHVFKRRSDNVQCFAWNSPQLDYALKGQEGRLIRITWLGKDDSIGRGRTMNEFRVQVSKSATPTTEGGSASE